MKIWKKALSVGLSLALCAGLVSPALAVTYDIADGSVYVENDANGVYSYQNAGAKKKTYTSEDAEIIVTGTTTKNTIRVGAGVTDTTITLKNVEINVGNTGNWSYNQSGNAAFSIGANSDVTVELDGENTLKSGYKRAGLELNDKDSSGKAVTNAAGGSVTIQDKTKEDSNGNRIAMTKDDEGAVLNAIGTSSAGIGSAWNGTAGNITIDGVKGADGVSGVTASGSSAAGIGCANSGGYSGAKSEVGNITIKGGSTVTATATGSYAAGIGGASGPTDPKDVRVGMAGNITIEGGSIVKATGGNHAAGIGSGWQGTVGDIIIRGGSTVTATGGNGSAGIGTGSNTAKAGTITIEGKSTVTAIGGENGAGIGGGNAYGKVAAIIIKDGSAVTAIGNGSGAGIGSSTSRYSSGAGAITVTDDVTLLALSYAGEVKAWAVDPNDENSTVAGNFLIGMFDDGVKDVVSSNSVFAMLDKEGNPILDKAGNPIEFDVNWEGTTYYSFAIKLPKDENGEPIDCIIVQKDADGNILNFLVYEDNMAVYGTKESEDGSVAPIQQDGLVLKNVKTTYEFKGEDDRKLPAEITSLATSYADSYGMVDAEGGKWAFRGWTNTDMIDENGKLQDVTFTGTWGFDGYNYTVEFNPNNGQQSTTASGKVDETTPDMPDDPAKGGYKFVGWVDKDGNVITSFEDYIPSEDGEKITVTALWVGKDYNVIVDPNGGSLPDGSEPTIPGKVGEEKKPEIPEPTRPGYDFNGWVVVDKDGNETEFDPDDFDPDGEDVHLKAKWDGDEYTVTVDPDNGEEPETQTGKVGGDTPEKPTEPTKNGYEFTGWEVVDEEGNPIVDKDGNPVDPFDPDFIPDEDGQKIIVKATWEKLPSKPTGGGNGGTTPTPPTDPTDPTGPVNPDPEEPVDIADPETPLGETPDEPADIKDPETPLGETPDETVDIEDPETPLGELPEMSDGTVEIDGPDVPLGGVPQTGEASTAMWLAVLLACGMSLVYVNTGKRKENA